MLKEFKKFISRGNVIDLAVAVIIGGAFSKIVSSLVNDIIMPIIGFLFGGIDFTNLSFTFDDAVINYGLFLQNIIDFFIISICIFLMIQAINKLSIKKSKEEEEVKVEKLSKDQELLIEIRDLLKTNKNDNV